MLSEYEAAMLTKQKAADPALAQRAPTRNRIGTVMLALSVLSAVGLLCAVLSDRSPAARATRADSTPAIAPPTIPIIHPAASGLPEAALFLRQASEAVQTTADMAASAR